MKHLRGGGMYRVEREDQPSGRERERSQAWNRTGSVLRPPHVRQATLRDLVLSQGEKGPYECDADDEERNRDQDVG